MKRLHIVGKSKDNKRLFLAKARDAKFGSFDVSISRKLLKLIEEVQETRKPARSRAKSAASTAAAAAEEDRAGVRLVAPAGSEEAPQAAAAALTPRGPTRPPGGGPSATPRPSDDLDLPVGPGAENERTVSEQPDDGEPDVATTAIPAAEPEEEVPPRSAGWIRPRTDRPEIPARSKLTPAEIQALIRSGRGVRSVANLAGTPVAWVRYLAEPIQNERQGIVQQMLTARQERSRLGPSALPIGQAIVENLRSRGLRSPESALEDGFTATKSDTREWRVRLVLDRGGRRQTALWGFDPPTRRVEPLNSLATQLGWRRPPSDESEEETSPRRTRKSTSRTSTRKSTTRKSTRRAAPKSARKRTAKRTTRKTTSRKKPAARRSTTRRAAASKPRRRTTSARTTSRRRR